MRCDDMEQAFLLSVKYSFPVYKGGHIRYEQSTAGWFDGVVLLSRRLLWVVSALKGHDDAEHDDTCGVVLRQKADSSIFAPGGRRHTL